MVKIKCDKICKELTFILSNLNNFHSLEVVNEMNRALGHLCAHMTGSCGSRQRDTTSSGSKLKLNNLAVKRLIEELIRIMNI